MKNNEVLANSIESFIDKYCHIGNRVSLPESELPIENVCKISIDAKTIIKVDTLWTFEGTALVSFNDANVTMNKQSTIIGNAKVTFYQNPIDPKDMLPNVESVTITKIR